MHQLMTPIFTYIAFGTKSVPFVIPGPQGNAFPLIRKITSVAILLNGIFESSISFSLLLCSAQAEVLVFTVTKSFTIPSQKRVFKTMSDIPAKENTKAHYM
jgi:hypothetical protein